MKPFKNIAVIGLGNMGGGIAACLAKKGYSLFVYDRSPEKRAAFLDSAQPCESAEEAVRAGGAILLSLVACALVIYLLTDLNPIQVYEAIVKGQNVPKPGVPESFKVLLKELQSLGLDVKVLKEDQTEVELMETVDYGDTDLRSVIEGDNKDYNRKEESSFGEYGYTKQEFEGDELVDVQEESAPDEAIFSPDEVFEEE